MLTYLKLGLYALFALSLTASVALYEWGKAQKSDVQVVTQTCKANDASASNDSLLLYLDHQNTIDITAAADRKAADARLAALTQRNGALAAQLKAYDTSHPAPAACAIDDTRVRILNAAGQGGSGL